MLYISSLTRTLPALEIVRNDFEKYNHVLIVAMDEIIRNKEFKIGGGDSRRHEKELIYFRNLRTLSALQIIRNHFNGNIIFLLITMGE